MSKSGTYLGIDVGSVSVNTILLADDSVIFEDYTRIKEQPVETVLKVLGKMKKDFSLKSIKHIGTTGTGGKVLSELLDGVFTNEIVAQTKSIERLYPDVKTIIDIGGQDAKMIMLMRDSLTKKVAIEGFAMNTICAAGTGSFLDQQALRLGISIENGFGDLALKSKKPPRIAGRCSVFAKTDMIHLQQEGTPDYDIVAGLCFALARAFKSNICKGKEIAPPVSFHGGVAANKGMVRAFKEILGLDSQEFIVPEYHSSMCAIGAAILAGGKTTELHGLDKLEEFMNKAPAKRKGLEPLNSKEVNDTLSENAGKSKNNDVGKAFLGIDVGSISTNVVVIDEHANLLARRYLPTSGRPIEAVRKGIKEIGEEIGGSVEIGGVGTTGSGRYLIGDFVGADIVKNEITAQATAAISINPSVDTIFEIGGQDSKYISIDNSAIVDFEMNKVCAAGTGSFLEEQAERLDVKIEDEFSEKAFASQNPAPLGERCTVFIESDLIHHQQQSMTNTEDLCAGLCYSIAHNYLNRVVGRRRIGNNIFFQGAVALNKGVVSAFEKILNKKITVPPNNDVTGAIGVAIVARDTSGGKSKSRFKGWKQIVETKYKLSSFECRDCPNQCEIREVETEGRPPLYYGSRCEKYNRDNSKEDKQNTLPDLFAEREKYLLNSSASVKPPANAKKVGIPRSLIFFDQYPFWKAFFSELGLDVILSDKTNKRLIRMGLDNIVEETCFPVKVAHGHIANLLQKKVDYIFLPMVVNMKNKNTGTQQSFNCPYIQTLSFMAKSAFNFKEHGVELLNPIIAFGWGDSFAKKSLLKFGKEMGFSKSITMKALEAGLTAENRYYRTVREKGRQVLADLPEDKIPIVVVSRSYNGCDSGINLNLPQKLGKLGAYPIPLDYLPLDDINISEEWPSMYWRCGQKILSAGKIIRNHTRLQCLYITNFGCGPDSFILQFFREQMQGKPFLEIEVDEHSADVGAITRCEAFMDSLQNVIKRPVLPPPETKKAYHQPAKTNKKRVFYIPYMGDSSYALRAALRAEKIPAELFPKSNGETLELGRKYTCGKECYPCIITTGDMLKIATDSEFDPGRAVFFMPSAMGPCRFGQYNRLQRMILDETGFKDVPIVSPNQINNLSKEFKSIGKTVFRDAWKGIVAIDMLGNMARKTRPYEINPGQTDEVYSKSLQMVLDAIEKKRDPLEPVQKSAQLFNAIQIDGKGEKPVIGVVGEIFVRSNEFSNDNLVRKLEEQGAEIWQASVSEWFLHVNRTVVMHDIIQRRYGAMIINMITGFVQHRDKHRLDGAASCFSGTFKESSIAETWRDAEAYLPGWFGEAALSLGRSEDFIRQNVSGIINVMPFACLPGTISSTIFKRFQEEHNNIPYITMAYDGLGQTNSEMRLESFVHQTKQYKNIVRK